MDKDYAAFLRLLSCAIKGTHIEIRDLVCDWNRVYELARIHRVDPLLYPVIKDAGSTNVIIKEWCDKSLIETARLAEKAEGALSLIDSLDRSRIGTILLKGIALRDIYPYPELRTMSDIDILVRTEDLDRAESVLRSRGYRKGGTDGRVSKYFKPGHLPVELHMKLPDPGSGVDAGAIESEIYERPVRYGGYKNVCVLDDETNLAYLILHAFTHFASYGVGVRQLCDIALLAGQKKESLDWYGFWKTVARAGISRFASSMLQLCRNYLGTDIGKMIPMLHDRNEERFLGTMMSEIIRGGVFGKDCESRVMETNILKLIAGTGLKRTSLVRAIFPCAERMGARYSYVRRNRMLLPLGWLHRIIRCLMKKTVKSVRYFMKILRLLFSERLEYFRSVGFVD
jgi:hypothetical protein